MLHLDPFSMYSSVFGSVHLLVNMAPTQRRVLLKERGKWLKWHAADIMASELSQISNKAQEGNMRHIKTICDSDSCLIHHHGGLQFISRPRLQQLALNLALGFKYVLNPLSPNLNFAQKHSIPMVCDTDSLAKTFKKEYRGWPYAQMRVAKQ